MKVKRDELIKLVDKLVPYYERDIVKTVELDIKHANPGDGQPTDVLTATIKFKSKFHGHFTNRVTRVIELFSSVDNQPPRVTETNEWEITDEREQWR